MNSQAIVAKPKVARVHQADLNHSISQPVSSLDEARLNERMKNVPQTRITTPAMPGSRTSRVPQIARIAASITAANSATQVTG